MIELEAAGYTYRGGEPLLREMSLHLPPGSFHFLTGPSGAGKSTLLKLCYFELFPTEGDIRILGRSVRGMSRDDIAQTRRRIGVMGIRQCAMVACLISN